MSDSTTPDLRPRGPTRIPFEAKVNLEFEKFSGFITEYSSNISSGGMFIKTNEPKPIGTVLSFEFKLSDNFKLMQGLGEVVWVRAQDRGPGKAAGMGVRFHELDAQSRELISTMVDQYVRQGGKPFDLEAELPEPGESSPVTDPGVEQDFKALFDVPEPAVEETDPLEAMEPLVPVEVEPPPPPEANKILIDDEAVREPIDLSDHLGDRKTTIRFDRPQPRRSSDWLLWFVSVVILLGAAGGSAYFFRDRLIPLIASLRERIGLDQPAPRVAEVEKPTPVATAQPTVTAQPTPIAASAPPTKIERITWSSAGPETIVTIWADAPFAAESYEAIRVDGQAPREVLKLRNIPNPYPVLKHIVGTSQLKRIRTGFHSAGAASEVHLVFDLASPRAKLDHVELSGPKLIVHLRG